MRHWGRRGSSITWCVRVPPWGQKLLHMALSKASARPFVTSSVVNSSAMTWCSTRLPLCCGLNVCILSQSHLVLGGWSGKWLGFNEVRRVGPQDGISAQYRLTPEFPELCLSIYVCLCLSLSISLSLSLYISVFVSISLSLSCYHVNTQWESGHLQIRNRALTCTMISDLQPPELWEINISVM